MMMRKWRNLVGGVLVLAAVFAQTSVVTIAENRKVSSTAVAKNCYAKKKTYSIYKKAKSFSKSSGRGGWSIGLDIEPDGSFSGSLHDSNMGETGEGYPNGTVYLCSFSGKFSAPKKISKYEYSAKIKKIKPAVKPGKSKIKDGIRYEYTMPPEEYKKGSEIRIYLPGKKTKGLPDDFLIWMGNPFGWGDVPKKFSFYAIRFKSDESGYYSKK